MLLGITINAKSLYIHIYGRIDFVELPKNISTFDLKFNFIIAPPIIKLFTLVGFLSAKFLIRIDPKEIPTK